MHLFLQGLIADLPSTAIIFHLEALGYSIAQIQILDGIINLGWFLRPAILVELQLLYQIGGVLTWFMLRYPFYPESVMLLAESCIAFHQSCVDQHGLDASDIRRLLLGRIAGAAIGGPLLRTLGRDACYMAESAFFWLLIPLTHFYPRVPKEKPEESESRPQHRLAVFLILLACLPDAGMPVFFFLSDKLAFTATEFAIMDGLGTLGTLLGTYLRLPRVALLFMVALGLHNSVLILVISRRVLWNPLVVLLPSSLILRTVGSSLATQYTVGAKEAVAFWSTLPLVGQVFGSLSSTGLTYGLGVDHDHYNNLLLLLLIAAYATVLPMLFIICVGEEEA